MVAVVAVVAVVILPLVVHHTLFTFDFRTVAGSRASATGSPRTLLVRCTPPGSLSLLNEEMIELELVAAAVRK